MLEFIVGAAGDDKSNLQDRVALLAEQPTEARASVEVSFRLLRHLASSIHHQQFQDTDIVTVRIAPGRTAPAAGPGRRGLGAAETPRADAAGREQNRQGN